MIYVMKQKLFRLGGAYNIKDQDGNDAYVVQGKVFSIGSKMSFMDLAGNELAFISQKLLSWMPTYEISRDGQLVAAVKKKFALLASNFTIEGLDCEVKGGFLAHEYSFTRGDQTVAQVSMQWFTLADTYGVQIADGEDPVLILAATVAIDLANEGQTQPNH
jgi:uncharacterized protein YxjI